MKHKDTTGLIVTDFIIAAVPFLVYASIFRSLPSEIPVHYSFDGIADRFASKLSVETVLLCSLGYCGLLLGVLLRKLVLAMGKAQENNNMQTTAKLMAYNQTFLTIFFSALSLYFISVILQNSVPDTLFILRTAYLVLSILFIIIGNYLPKLKKNPVSGVKTKYSQSSDDAWMKSQRFGGRLLAVGGSASLIVCLIPSISTKSAVMLSTMIFVVMILGLLVYSAVEMRRNLRGEGHT